MTNKSAAILFFTLLFLPSCINIAGECETAILSQSFNPSGYLQAVKDVTDCGATTSVSYGLRIVESTDTIATGTQQSSIITDDKDNPVFAFDQSRSRLAIQKEDKLIVLTRN